MRKWQIMRNAGGAALLGTFVALTGCGGGGSNPPPTGTVNVAFTDAADKPFALYDLKDRKAIVVVFLSFECPMSTNYAEPLADLAKAGKSKELIASVSTKGGIVDITFQLFAQKAGIKLTTIPGAGGADAVTSLVGGHVDFGGGHPSEVLPHIKAGRLRGLAVAFEKRDPAVAVPGSNPRGPRSGHRDTSPRGWWRAARVACG